MSVKYEEATQKILNGLAEFREFYSRDYYLEFEDRISTMRDRIEESKREGRLQK